MKTLKRLKSNWMISILQSLVNARQKRRFRIVVVCLGVCSSSFGIGALLHWLPAALAWISIGIGVVCFLLVVLVCRYGTSVYNWLFEFIATRSGIRRLHLGCGDIRKESYLNVDARITKATDLVVGCADLQFPTDSVETIESYHLLEHLDRKGGRQFLKNCYRMLQKKGRLIIECPDFSRTIESFWEPHGEDENRMKCVYGNQRNTFEFHKWGYFPESIRTLLLSIGFSEVQISEGTDYHAETEPCMLVEAVK